MTLTVYRLGKRVYRDRLFSGQGGLYATGRWTPRGRPVVYTSASISLAVLEYTVNYRRRGWVPASVLGRAMIPGTVRVETISIEKLPANWFAAAPPPQLQVLGGEWLERGQTAVLKVPSAVVIEEWNYLLNPLHMDFAEFRITAPKPFDFDQRVTRSRKT
ncbi:MAG: RES domain-containing protein [Proteobacteria bacterium]|nr:RES domain-containing protein [Pseudomonadota bacterium]